MELFEYFCKIKQFKKLQTLLMSKVDMSYEKLVDLIELKTVMI